MAAKPRPAAPAAPRRRTVQTAGDQKDFHPLALALARKLGWDGEPDWVQVAPSVLDQLKKENGLEELPEVTHEIAAAHGITVRDAVRYCAKLLHEHFAAGALGKEQPDYIVAAKHLAVDTADERAALDAACKEAFDAGKGAAVTEHPVKNASMDVEMTASASSLMGKLANPVSNVKKGT